MERKTGENFDDKTAEDIFDKLRNVEGKIKPKRKGKFDNITNLMQEAELLVKDNNYDEAIKLYKEVIYILQDSSKAYEAIANIYKIQGDVESEKDILKKAISNCSNNADFKKRFDEIK